MLMYDLCLMKFDRDVFGKEIWVCVEIGCLFVNFYYKIFVFNLCICCLLKCELN